MSEERSANEAAGAEAPRGMLPIWFWIGAILIVYGLIVFGLGLARLGRPAGATVLAATNPGLWWGGIMLVTGLVFFVVSMRGMKRGAGTGEGASASSSASTTTTTSTSTLE